MLRRIVGAGPDPGSRDGFHSATAEVRLAPSWSWRTRSCCETATWTRPTMARLPSDILGLVLAKPLSIRRIPHGSSDDLAPQAWVTTRGARILWLLAAVFSGCAPRPAIRSADPSTGGGGCADAEWAVGVGELLVDPAREPDARMLAAPVSGRRRPPLCRPGATDLMLCTRAA